MKTMQIQIRGDKVTLIKALEALAHAKIEVMGVRVAPKEMKLNKAKEKAYKLAEAFEDKE